LQVLLRELDQVLVPELSSARARTTASLISQVLRQLIIRETRLPGLREAWMRRQEALLATEGVPSPFASAASPEERFRLVTAAVAETAGLRASQKNAQTQSGIRDPWTREAIEAERQH